jgi:hypothetical protein
MGDDEMPTQLPSPSQVSAFPLPYGLPINGQAGRLIKSRHALEVDSYARDGPASMGAQTALGRAYRRAFQAGTEE